MKNISIVTGGNSGLGYSISKLLVKMGNNVCIIGRTEKTINESKKSLKEVNDSVEIISKQGNIADEAFVKSVYKDLSDSGYTVNYLFNSAGVGGHGPASENTKDLVSQVLESNFIGLILMCTGALSAMKDDGGKIINIMSTAALTPKPGETVYCAAKYGAKGYTDALREELKGSNIKVIAVYPGGMDTPFWDRDCGRKPDVSKFMDPNEVAKQIVNSVVDYDTLFVKEMTIEKDRK